MTSNTANPYLIVVPTYNERENIAWLIERILRYDVDVLIVDDASPDGTGEVADALARENPGVRVLHRQGRRGLGRAYQDAFKVALAAGYDCVVTMDADGSHSPEVIPHLLFLSDTFDLVLGSRRVPGGGCEGWVRRRRFLSSFGSSYARAVLSVPVRDLTGGFKCYRREVLEVLDGKKLDTVGYAFQVETTYRAILAGFSVAEIPITFLERRAGRSKMSLAIAIEAALILPLFRFRLRRLRVQMKSASPRVRYQSLSLPESPLVSDGRRQEMYGPPPTDTNPAR